VPTRTSNKDKQDVFSGYDGNGDAPIGCLGTKKKTNNHRCDPPIADLLITRKKTRKYKLLKYLAVRFAAFLLSEWSLVERSCRRW
jgi:hypothetical protein